MFVILKELFVVCLYYTYIGRFARGHESNSFQIIKKVKIKVCVSAVPNHLNHLFSFVIYIIGYGFDTLGHFYAKSLENT